MVAPCSSREVSMHTSSSDSACCPSAAPYDCAMPALLDPGSCSRGVAGSKE
eukprot:CAMPEP_0197607134 /NCGR_PEP_ID=MMETSP1326-20131121/46494_1 /TAXON_ID=1155430 /ORGANISM="Genus nov. species nov., Strain RCC2288" /LENGTH=50 /DNA_ID=CAMNT_0043175163 /DNA_START=50 /DNA_END=199 /DNA_ORIENTATION=+